MTPPGMWNVEKFARRSSHLVGALGMCVWEFLVANVGVTISTENTAGQKVLVAFVCIYIAFFASTWDPIAWVISGEIYPLNIRAKAMSMSIASNWLWNFALGFATPHLVNKEPGSAGLGIKVFFIWDLPVPGASFSPIFALTRLIFLFPPPVTIKKRICHFRRRVCRSNRSTSCTRTPPR